MQETEKIWMNGELVDWADAKVHVGVHGLHYGSGVFEGIRCYDTSKGPAVFRLREHLERLESSARILFMDMPYSVEELRQATHELLATNGLASCYVRPIAFYGYSELGVAATDDVGRSDAARSSSSSAGSRRRRSSPSPTSHSASFARCTAARRGRR